MSYLKYFLVFLLSACFSNAPKRIVENKIDCNESDVSKEECQALVTIADFAGYEITSDEKNGVCDKYIDCKLIDGKNHILSINWHV